MKSSPRSPLYCPFPEFNAHVNTVRGSGATLATVVTTIGYALSNPGEWVGLRDHHPNGLESAWGLLTEVRRCLHVDLEVDNVTKTIKAPLRGVRGEPPYVSR